MTAREGQASGVESAPRSAAKEQPANATAPPSSLSASAETSWEDLFRAFSPIQKRDLLALASEQGLLYAHQLPHRGNGSSFDPGRNLLSSLLEGAVEDLPAFQSALVALHDSDLDAHQREAVAQALDTPDIFLIQGLPGTGKSRVAAEIISQAAARGQRILLLAPAAV